MRALLKHRGAVTVTTDAPTPPLRHPTDVRVRVALAALCRTDLYAARGLLATPDTIVLGHEFSGTIDAVGAEVHHLTPGDRVAVHPALPCLSCPHCPDRCQHTRFLGVHRDGAFAEQVVVPAGAVHPLPDALSFAQGAYAEPVAASLAVTKALRPAEHPRVAIYGQGRIAELTRRVLAAEGVSAPILGDADLAEHDSDLDAIIETLATTDSIQRMALALRPSGLLVLKSRQIEPVALNLAALLPRELELRMVLYGAFGRGLELMASGKLRVDDLCGPVHTLEDWEAAFHGDDERHKVFFDPTR